MASRINLLISNLISVLVSSALPAGVFAQQFQETRNATEGSTSRFSLTLTQTHGVSSSVTMTPDYLVETKANLVIAPGSSTKQETLQQATASLNPNGERGLEANGATGKQDIFYADGTQYQVQITPRIKDPNDNSWKTQPLSQASGQAGGVTSTNLTVDSTVSSFVNSFVNSLSR
jgi:hypothetical protein